MRKVAVITGGRSGIGRAVAELLVADDWYAVQADNNFQGDELSGFGEYNCQFRRVCDVEDNKQVVDLFEWVSVKFGRLDLLVNNAGIHSAKSITIATSEDFNRIVAVNLAGPFYCMQAALPLLEKCRGSIVNVGSDVCFLADKDAPLYTMTKMGLMGLTQAAALEWGAKGVRINMVCPGATDTPFLRNAFPDGNKAVKICGAINPLKRIASPVEIAKVIIFLGLEATFANAAVWAVDGGYTAKGADEPPKS